MARPNFIDLQNTITDMLYCNNISSKEEIEDFKTVIDQNIEIAIDEYVEYLKEEGLYD